MPHSAKDWIVDTDWLANHLQAPDLVIFDGSWYMPGSDRDPKAEYLESHIPGTLFFDIDDLVDEQSDLPHMLPSTVKFASRMKKMGVGDGARIVVYDTNGLFSAARVWWTFRAMGHDEVAVLNGGLEKWIAEDRQVDDGPAPPRTERHYTPRLNAELIRDLDDMRGLLGNDSVQVVDARPNGRFSGRDPEPRPGLRQGHMPGAKNLPFNQVLNADGTMKSRQELMELFRNVDINPRRPVVTTCGSGITDSILSLALAVVGQTNAPVYDGSWAEWGKDNGLPVAQNLTESAE